MKRLALGAAIALAGLAAPARADTVDEHLVRVRALFERGDFERARAELQAAYRLEPRPELLFALGQVELNTGHLDLAIDYYQRFIATQPSAEQAALAEQAIGAARARQVDRRAAARPRQRRWDAIDTGLSALGGAALIAGGGMLIASQRLADDTSGRLSSYEDRLSRAHLLRALGVGGAAVGVVAITSALLRWRFHLVDVGVDVRPAATGDGASLVWERRW